MSNRAEELLKYYADQGLTIEILASLSQENISDLTDSNGNKINQVEKFIILGKINQYKESKSKTGLQTSIKSSLKSVLSPQTSLNLPKTSTQIINPSPSNTLTIPKVNFSLPITSINPSGTQMKSQTRIEMEKVQAENERLKEENQKILNARKGITSIIEERDKYKAEKAISKKRIEDYLSKTAERTTIAIKDAMKMVRELKSLGTNLDICFCIDGTGSMSGIIGGVRNCIINVSQKISAGTGMSCRFALVVYRDYCDGSLRRQVWDFTNSSNLASYLGSVTAQGGGDGPEDCFGGLYAACTSLSWKAPSRVIIWMGDSPTHGLKYSGGGDDYPHGDPDGITSDKIFDQLRSNKIILVFCKLTSYTDRMMAELRNEVATYGDNLLLEYNLEGDNISEFLVKTITTTTAKTLSFFSKSGKEKSYSLTPASWVINSSLWRDEEICEIIKFKPYTGSELHPLLDLLLDGPNAEKRDARISVTLNPVARGEMRLAYYGKIVESREFIMIPYSKVTKKGIVKESRYEGEINRRKYLVNQAKIQTAACYMADQFNKRMKELKINERKFIYVPVELLHIPGRTTGNNYFSLEPYIEGNYVKFNNNSGYIDRELSIAHDVVQTFSHFTFSFSKGLIMVTDVQGVINTESYKLTDPAIHTADDKRHLPDPTNLGVKGFAAFFATHVCNEICRKMDLKLPDGIDTSTPFDTPKDTVMSSINEDEEWEEFDDR